MLWVNDGKKLRSKHILNNGTLLFMGHDMTKIAALLAFGLGQIHGRIGMTDRCIHILPINLCFMATDFIIASRQQ